LLGRRGFTLIEIMVAILVMSVGILGVFSLVPMAISLGTDNSDKFTASQLALEGLEIVRNIRDSNWLEQNIDPDNAWNEGLMGCADGCEVDYEDVRTNDPTLASYSGQPLRIDTNGFFNYYSDGVATKFKRKIIIDSNTDYVLNISVAMEWPSKYSPMILQEKLYDWR